MRGRKYENKKILGVVALGVGVVTLTACSADKSSTSKKVLNWSETAQMSTLDSSKVTDIISGTVLNNVNEGLYRIGANNKIEPGIATKTKVSANQTQYTFTLRHNAKWSNGDPVTAQDFVFA